MRQLAFKKCETAIELYKDINEIPYERGYDRFYATLKAAAERKHGIAEGMYECLHAAGYNDERMEKLRELLDAMNKLSVLTTRD